MEGKFGTKRTCTYGNVSMVLSTLTGILEPKILYGRFLLVSSVAVAYLSFCKLIWCLKRYADGYFSFLRQKCPIDELQHKWKRLFFSWRWIVTILKDYPQSAKDDVVDVVTVHLPKKKKHLHQCGKFNDGYSTYTGVLHLRHT